MKTSVISSQGVKQNDRRDFLKRLTTGGLAAASLPLSVSTASGANPTEPQGVNAPGPIPSVTIAGVRIPRMLIGCNPIGGWSHSVRNLSLAMPDYFTLERTVEF